MKRADWALVVLVVSIVGVVSYFVISSVVPSPSKEPQKVQTAEEIRSDVAKPSSQIYNDNAINPTVKTSIGDQSDQSPFTVGDN